MRSRTSSPLIPSVVATYPMAGERDANFFSIVASDLEAVRAPAQVRLCDSDITVMAAFLMRAGMTAKEKPMNAHDAIDPLVILTGGRPSPDGARRPRRAHSPRRACRRSPLLISASNPSSGYGGLCALEGARTPDRRRSSDAHRLADGFHGEPSLGRESDRNVRIFDSVAAIPSASLRISFSSDVFPRRRCNSRICSCWAERRNGNDFFFGLRRPQRALLGQPPPVNSWLGETPRRRVPD
jgi:hypothetical protein